MTDNKKLDPWELLREARESVIALADEYESLMLATETEEKQRELARRIDAALAAHRDEVPAQDSATPVVESDDPWWEDKLFRAVFGSSHLTIQAKGPRSWSWSVSFTDRKDKHGLSQVQYGTATTEAEAKSAAIAAARGLK